MSKPSVALIRVSEYEPEIAVRGTGIFEDKWYVGGPRLGSQHGFYEDRVEIIRALVVIDPEDWESAKRLTQLMFEVAHPFDGRIADTQAALREFANPTPPKPEEPLGLGAVIEDAEGRKWVRDLQGRASSPWLNSVIGNLPCRMSYGDLDVVRVLSEGVTE